SISRGRRGPGRASGADWTCHYTAYPYAVFTLGALPARHGGRPAAHGTDPRRPPREPLPPDSPRPARTAAGRGAFGCGYGCWAGPGAERRQERALAPRRLGRRGGGGRHPRAGAAGGPPPPRDDDHTDRPGACPRRLRRPRRRRLPPLRAGVRGAALLRP